MWLWWLAYSLPAGSARRSVFIVLGLRNRQQGHVSVSSFQRRFGIFPVVLWYNMKVGVAATLKDWLWPKGVWVVRLIPCWESLGSRSERIASQSCWLLVVLGSSQVWNLTKSWFLQEMLSKSCHEENRPLPGELKHTRYLSMWITGTVDRSSFVRGYVKCFMEHVSPQRRIS